MWNLKNQSYIVMSEEVPNSIVINVEDFHLNQLAFQQGNGGNKLYANVKQLKVYDKALTDSELKTLTTS